MAGIEHDLRCRRVGPPLFRDVKAWYQSMFYFEEPKDATLITLFTFQTRCYRMLPTVFYSFIKGAPGSGKTCLLSAMAMLGHGVLLGNISVSAMARELGRGREIKLESNVRVAKSKMSVLYHLGCFDEYDAKGNKDKHDAMDEMLRHGYRWDGPAYVRWDMENNRSKAWDLYMPKAAAVTRSLDPALASRGLPISAAPYDGPDGYPILLHNRYPKKVAELNAGLDSWGDSVNRSFDMEQIEALETSDEHTKHVEAISGGLGLNRRNEHALTCVTISHLAGVDIDDELRYGIDRLPLANEEYEDEIEEINEAIIAIAGQQGPIEAAASVTLKQSAVKKFIDKKRDEIHIKPLSSTRFAEIYRAAGIHDSWIRPRHGCNYWVIPMPRLQVIKGLLNLPNLPNLPENLDQQTLKVDQVDQVGSLKEDFEKGIPYDILVERYGSELVEREKIPKIGGRE
jgi:hypothetical protein